MGSVLSTQDAVDFMTKLAKKMGKLVKGGEPDLNNVAVSLINDFQRVSVEARHMHCRPKVG